MSDEATKLIECPLEYSLSDDGGAISSGAAVGRIDEENVSIVPKLGEAILFSPREILEFAEGDYSINLLLTSKEKLAITKLGINFENFSRILSKARNDVVMKDMLMQESLVLGGLKGFYEYEGRSGGCELRLFEAGLVLAVERGEPLRFQYSNIAGIAEGDYSLTLTMESGEKLTISRMGGRHEPFKKALNDAMNTLTLKTQELIKGFTPGIDSSSLRRAARLMRDGKAARKADLDAISPAIWRGLEKKIEEVGILEEYKFIGTLAQKDRMCAGFKRGLMGDVTGDYVWILAPVPASNAMILEAVTVGEGETVEPLQSAAEGEATEEEPKDEEVNKSGGRWATYVFSIVPRSQYPAADMDAAADAFIRSLNDCMLSINFRREPIFTSDEDLELPRNIKYWYSVQKLPLLRELRSHFVGRAIHVNKAQWQKAVRAVLEFNVKSKDDRAKYTK
ncbi:conserved hypothetical protein [Methanocella paludicola SANAE]|uniref:Uncharacterized protein n=1 Tax=Methanocella paludicola (strain DSM 17711 / JCM 13418 / NBRC 101707 / SANAE) TaxID=304371 RepID=D1YUW0_METPS|nr:hypothetical protein [Methanocella paludicola]BAI60232.1 conserved hypothetical protein [Methanocella paludicola SANAE]